MSAILALVLACLTTLAFAATPSTTTSTSMYPKTAFSTDFSDIWWNPSESGWGLQMVQESSFIFATMFIYGTNGSPTWVTAEMNNVGGLTFSGPLYVTRESLNKSS